MSAYPRIKQSAPITVHLTHFYMTMRSREPAKNEGGFILPQRSIKQPCLNTGKALLNLTDKMLFTFKIFLYQSINYGFLNT